MAKNIAEGFEIIPASGIIIVSPLEEHTTGAFQISDTAAFKDQVGLVEAVGPEDVYEQDPNIIRTTEVKVGDKIVHTTWSNVSLTTKNGKKIRFIRFQDVLGVYK